MSFEGRKALKIEMAWFFSCFVKTVIMKHLMQIIKRPLLAVFSVLVSVIAFAQDKKVDVDINTSSGGNWYAQPWVWVVGAAVFILLLVALTRSGTKSDA